MGILFYYGMDMYWRSFANQKRTLCWNWPEWIFWSLYRSVRRARFFILSSSVSMSVRKRRTNKWLAQLLLLPFRIIGAECADLVCLGLSSAAAIRYSGTSLMIVATNIYPVSVNSCCWRFRFRIIRKYHGKGGFHAPDPFADTCKPVIKGGIANV